MIITKKHRTFTRVLALRLQQNVIYITAKPCISSIPQELHIIKTEFCISSLRKFFDARKCVMISSPDGLMKYNNGNAVADDIPSLSQWIKNKTAKRPSYFWCERRDADLFCKSVILGRPHTLCAVPASDFVAKNSPPDCFLNAPHPLRVQAPYLFCK